MELHDASITDLCGHAHTHTSTHSQQRITEMLAFPSCHRPPCDFCHQEYPGELAAVSRKRHGDTGAR
jgi:hypothetical protein